MLNFHLSKNFKNKKIKQKFIEDIEPQEVLLDALAKQKEKEMHITEKKIETPLSKNVLKGFLIISFVLILFLFVKAFQFQVLDNKKFFVLAEKNRFKIYQIQAERGVIYDRYGKQLVWNKPSFDLILNIKDLPSDETIKLKILEQVSQILQKKINLEEIKPKGLVLIQKNLDNLSLIIFETKINSGELPGFQIQQNFIREYQSGFSHLIGYTSKISEEELKNDPNQYSIFDWVGETGLEKSYEQILRKNPGKLLVQKDAFNNVISEQVISLPESGKNLVLWIDSELQKKIKEILQEKLKIYGGEKAVAIAMDPRTGGILALISLPDFDNNLFQRNSNLKELQEVFTDIKQPLFNRAISGLYPTGSTIKPLLALAALEEKIINPEKQIFCPGFIEIGKNFRFNDWRPHGLTDMRKAIAESSNVYFYIIGGGYKDQQGLGPALIKKYLELFNWGNKTGIDLPGEQQGSVPSPEWKKKFKKQNWQLGDTYNISIGQGDMLITPLQVVTSFAALANNGKLMKPIIVQKIIDKNKNLIKEIKPEIIRENFVNQENLQIVRQGMRLAVTSPSGSSNLLNSLPVSSASKTGTAQIFQKKHYHNWITVFAPYENPEIVLTIMIENIKIMRIPALSAAKEILEWYFTKNK